MKAGCGGMIVTVADALSVESSLWTAVTLTVDGFGAIAGAVYRPSAVIVPPVRLPPRRPLTRHRKVGRGVAAPGAPKQPGGGCADRGAARGGERLPQPAQHTP